jgi:hypothetical protein
MNGVSRRQIIGLPLALLCAELQAAQYAAVSPPKTPVGGPPRFALLIGNRIYPAPFDLPPVHKNIRDMQAALEQRGFEVTVVVDQDQAVLRQAMQAYARRVQAAPADATVLFYFTGHGAQVDAENLLLGAGTNPTAKEDSLVGGSLMLKRDLVDALPRRAEGLSMVVIDACRTSLKAALEEGGLNQVEAPLGCLIAFATAAGKPAIAPAVETLNTFYTASLVKLLQSSADEVTFSDLFRLVKRDVQQTMENHPVAAIRQVAQHPFIAENTHARPRLSPRLVGAAAEVKFGSADEQTLWKQVEASAWPGDVVKLCDSYLAQYPNSKLAPAASVAREGATEAAKAMQRNDVRLYRSAFNGSADMSAGWWREVRKAARGDKDAAARLGHMYKSGDDGVQRDENRFQGWLQYAAALGNGIASYELALYYREQDQPLLAAQFETRARELGYTPPPSLDHYRK